MKPKYIIIFCGMGVMEGIASLYALLTMTFTAGRGGTFDYATVKWAVAGVVVLALVALAALGLIPGLKPGGGAALSAWLDEKITGPKKRLFFVQGTLLVLAVFLGECFFITYLAFPEPTRPLFFWSAILCLQAWVFLRVAYQGEHRARPGLMARLRTKWNGWMPVQRKVFGIMVVFGLLYFAVFIPFNLMRDSDGNFPLNQDEQVMYPEITKPMVFPLTAAGVAHGPLESWGWQYGYPFFTASAAVLFLPRLVFGAQFVEHVCLNIFLLRQFVSVLPMTVALLLVVYLVTRFKNMLASVSAFIFLAAMPGIVKYNYRFYHPDALIVLLIVMGLFGLYKDKLRFGRFFYLAAVCCGLAAIIKLWGLFFGPLIAGYLLAGFIKKRLTLGGLFLKGGLFVLTMLGAAILSTPTLMAPYIARVALQSWLPRQGYLLGGYPVPDPTGDYRTGLTNWLQFFGFHFMKGYFFYFAFLALIVSSFLGSRQRLNRILLGWCAVVAIFLAYFVALKNFQYMLPLALPLGGGVFLFPAITDGPPTSKWTAFLARPLTRRIVRWVTATMVASQLAVNLVILVLFAVRGH